MKHIKYLFKRINIKLLFLLIIILTAAFLSGRSFFYIVTSAITDMNLNFQKVNKAAEPYKLLWFDYKGETINLNLNNMIDAENINIYANKWDNSIAEIKANSQNKTLNTDKDYVGTFVAVLPPFSKDLNNDGVAETVSLTSKTDTLLTHVIDHWTKSDLLDPRIPMELVHVFNPLIDKQIQVFYNQKPLANESIQVISNNGTKNIKTDLNGFIVLGKSGDLTNGFSVLFVKDNVFNIASYTLETATLFTQRHLESLSPVFDIVICALAMIIIFSFGRKVYFKFA